MTTGARVLFLSAALLLSAPANSIMAEELLWRQSYAAGPKDYGNNLGMEIQDGLKCVQIRHWSEDKSKTHITLLRYESEKFEVFQSSVENSWLPGKKEYNPRITLISRDCRYWVEKYLLGNDGLIRDLRAGKIIAQSKNLFGGGEIRISEDGRYLISSGSLGEDESGETMKSGEPKVTTITGKKTKWDKGLIDGTPVFGGKYFVTGQSMWGEWVLDKNAESVWSLWCIEGRTPPCLWSVPGADIHITMMNQSKNNLYFIARESVNYRNSAKPGTLSVYLAKWGEKGIEKKVPLSSSGDDFRAQTQGLRKQGLLNYGIKRGFYAFSNDSAKVASFHFLSTGAARVSLADIEGRIIWSRDYDMAREFAGCKASGYDYFQEMGHEMIRFSGNRIILNLVKNDGKNLQQCDVNTVLDLSGTVIYRRQDDLNVPKFPHYPDMSYNEVRYNMGNRFFLVNENEYVRYEVKPVNDKTFMLEFYRGSLK